MDRRQFLLSSTVFGAATLISTESRGALSCGQTVVPGLGPRQLCTSGIDSSVATIFAAFQTHSEWCWAASMSMIFRYFNHSVSQERIVKETWGKIVNMPGTVDQILADLNRDWTDDSGDDFTSTGDAYTANPVTAAQDLANNEPLLICSLGHAMVLTALTYIQDPYAPGGASVTQAIVRDPWPANGGKRMLSVQEWTNVSLLARVRVENA
jgi:hypothetical protein